MGRTDGFLTSFKAKPPFQVHLIYLLGTLYSNSKGKSSSWNQNLKILHDSDGTGEKLPCCCSVPLENGMKKVPVSYALRSLYRGLRKNGRIIGIFHD
jgi:hypothetical protein